MKASSADKEYELEESRPTCWQCVRPESHCHCKLVSPFSASNNMIILQHPRERKRYYSTSKLITKWLNNCKLLSGIEFPKEEILNLFPNTNLSVLFPSESSAPANTFEFSKAKTTIVIDGTWSEAKKIYRLNPWLTELPHISISPTHRSRYRIRKQPKAECLSTIEAIAYMFIENAGEQAKGATQYKNLLKGFDYMVATHLGSIPLDKVTYYDPA